MNRTIVILNLLVSSISIARPTDETTTAQIEDDNYKIDDLTLRIPDEMADVIVKNDDVLNTSELNIYNSFGNKFTKTRSLKEESDNDRFIKADLKKESRVAIKSAENLDNKPEEKKSSTTDKAAAIETKAANEEESKTDKTIAPITKVEDVESKVSKEESKSVQVSTSEISEMESTTTNFRAEGKTSDYLENVKNDYYEKVTTDEGYARKGYEIPINDESNTAWDLLDDLPASRRMLSQPDYLNIESKGRTGVENVEPVKPVQHIEAKNVPETNVETPRNHNHSHVNAFGSQTNPVILIPQVRPTAVSIPHNHHQQQPLLPHRRFIVPGFITIRPAVSIDFRRLLNQETNNVLNQNLQYENEYRSERNNMIHQNQNYAYDPDARYDIPPEFKDVTEDYSSKELSNAYPYTPAVLETPNMPKVSAVNPLFAKLLHASEHPKRFTPNVNVGNIQNNPGMHYNSNMGRNYYAVPQNNGIYKYVTGFRRSR